MDREASMYVARTVTFSKVLRLGDKVTYDQDTVVGGNVSCAR